MWMDALSPPHFGGLWPIDKYTILLSVVAGLICCCVEYFQILQELGVASGLWPQVDQIKLFIQ